MPFGNITQSPAKLLAGCARIEDIGKKFQHEPCIYLMAGLYSTPKLR